MLEPNPLTYYDIQTLVCGLVVCRRRPTEGASTVLGDSPWAQEFHPFDIENLLDSNPPNILIPSFRIWPLSSEAVTPTTTTTTSTSTNYNC